jgi:hypothetical protein
MENKKRQLRPYWALGFLSLNLFQGFRYFQTNDWFDLIWFVWIVWLAWFIPIKKKS